MLTCRIQTKDGRMSDVMLCPKCKAPISDAARFCPECGSKIDQENQASIKSRIQLRCKHCDGIMEVDPDRPIIYCQYCGSKELLNESDKVTVQRIKSKTHKEIELERLKFQREKFDREESSRKRQELEERERDIKSRQESFRRGPLKIIIIVFFVLSVLSTAYAISETKAIMAAISITQAIVFAIAWLKGMQFIKERRPNSRIVFAIIGLILIIPIIRSCNADNHTLTKEEKEPSTFLWPSTGMCTLLPTPNTNLGELNIYSNSILLELDQCTSDDYYNYVDSCIAAGFSIDIERDNTNYQAYNEDGYKVRAWYSDYSKEIQVDFDAPIQMNNIEWPSTKICSLLPVPESLWGNIDYNKEDWFSVYIGNTSFDAYEDYIVACQSNGFTSDCQKDNDSFSATNRQGYSINVEFEGFEIMYIRIKAPDSK